MKNTVANAGHAVADAAKNVSEKIAHGADEAAECVKDKTGMVGPAEGTDLGVGGIKKHMKVIASCGKTVGIVDDVESNAIKLTRKDSPDGQHHFIPVGWVERVDSHVHLSKNSRETEKNWKADALSCGCTD
jgi:hypothetical protein